jgi:hypothetical protein
MRKIYNYLKTYWQEEVKLSYLLIIMVFLASCIFLEYQFNLASGLMRPYKWKPSYFVANLLFYSLPVFFSILLYIYFYNRKDLLKNTSFWLVLIYIIGAYAFRAYFYHHKTLIIELNDNKFDPYLASCANQFTQAFLLFFVVIIYWIFSGDRKQNALYGFKLKGIDIKPYFILLLIVLPLIVFASTQPDFLGRYPTFGAFVHKGTGTSGILAKMGIYEFLYGTDYVATELFFRGFMIYVLAKFMGKGAIIPMATMYVFIHFGKPAGETISSFFGGMVLGIISYETKSIIGGIIIHCGIAYMMEVGGFIGNLFF